MSRLKGIEEAGEFSAEKVTSLTENMHSLQECTEKGTCQSITKKEMIMHNSFMADLVIFFRLMVLIKFDKIHIGSTVINTMWIVSEHFEIIILNNLNLNL